MKKGKCAFPMLLSRLYNDRLSAIKLSRFSSFAAENAPEANLWSRDEDGNLQASLQRSTVRTQARKPIEQRYNSSTSGESDASGGCPAFWVA